MPVVLTMQFVDFCQTVSWCVLPDSPYCTGHEVKRQVSVKGVT